MKNVIAILVIALILALAITYIVRQKKKGIKCIGCPSAKNCPHSGKGCTPKH
jgi:hypothetical protein